VTDLQETPAVPPEANGGDERFGYFVAGAILVALGWVFGVVVNVLLHWAARSAPATIWGVHVGANFGDYAWAVFGLGLVTGAMGVVLIGVGRSTPSGPLVLPGVEY
jgi:hypothetical protein